MEAQRAHKAPIEATKESKDLDSMKTRAKLNNWEAHMKSSGAQFIEEAIQYTGNSTTFSQVCRSQSRQIPKDDKRSRVAHDTCLENEDKVLTTQEFDMLRSKVFNFCNSNNCKVETKSNQKVDTSKHKIDIGSDGYFNAYQNAQMLFTIHS